MKLRQEVGHERAVSVKAKLTCEGTQVLFFYVCACLFLKHHHIPPRAPSSGLSRPAPRCSLALPREVTAERVPRELSSGRGGEKKVKGLIFILWDCFPLPHLPPAPSLFATLC